MGFHSISVLMKIPIIAIAIIAIVILSIDREITRSLTLPKFALCFTHGVLPVRLMHDMMGFHSILNLIKIAIIAIVVTAIVTIVIDKEITRSLTLPKFVLCFTHGVLKVRFIYHMICFHSILTFLKIVIVAISITAIDRKITDRKITRSLISPNLQYVLLTVFSWFDR